MATTFLHARYTCCVSEAERKLYAKEHQIDQKYFNENVIVADKLRNDPEYRKWTANIVTRRNQRSGFRQDVRLAEDLRAARDSRLVSGQTRCTDNTPSVSLGMTKGMLSRGRYPKMCPRQCPEPNCRDRFLLAKQAGLKVETLKCLAREQQKAAAKRREKIARQEAMHSKLRSLCEQITSVDVLVKCTRCTLNTAFSPLGKITCMCPKEVAGKELTKVMTKWVRNADEETEKDEDGRAQLSQVLDCYAHLIGSDDKFEIFFLEEDKAQPKQMGSRRAVLKETYRIVDFKLAESEAFQRNAKPWSSWP